MTVCAYRSLGVAGIVSVLSVVMLSGAFAMDASPAEQSAGKSIQETVPAVQQEKVAPEVLAAVKTGVMTPAAKENRISSTVVAPAATAEAADDQYVEDTARDKALDDALKIADPLEPLNKAVYHFNDKLYLWALDPAARGYSHVVHENVRVGVSNFFGNLRSPVNVINNFLQGNFKRSGLELFRLFFNTAFGLGGLIDSTALSMGIERQEANLGQTLGSYGIGHGCYLVLPVFGPSSLREGIGLVGDQFMSPPTYIGYFLLDFWPTAGVTTFERINDTSFKLGDYQLMKKAALDPYDSMRDAFVQYHLKKVRKVRDAR